MEAGKEKVAVVVVAYRSQLDPYEEIALKQCLRILSSHPLIVVKPLSLNIGHWPFSDREIQFESFPDAHFQNIDAYSRLLLSPAFYKRFLNYEYILIYQLDAFVFSDTLLSWCNKSKDYVGAPWFERFSSKENEGDFIGVGNGGFSLRNVAAHLKVLNTFSYITRSKANWSNRFKDNVANNSWLKNIAGFILDHTVRNNTHWLLNNYKGNEDMFWGLSVAPQLDWFKVPDYEEAAAFAFEMQPRRLFELNQHQLPFGCHAWWKYDLDFWKPHIESFGYQL